MVIVVPCRQDAGAPTKTWSSSICTISCVMPHATQLQGHQPFCGDSSEKLRGHQNYAVDMRSGAELGDTASSMAVVYWWSRGVRGSSIQREAYIGYQ